VLPLLVDELPLLLQPAAAKAIAARPAIAVVRFMIFIFLSFDRVIRLREARWMARFGLHAPAAAESWTIWPSPVRRPNRAGIDSCQRPGQGKHHREHLGRLCNLPGTSAASLPETQSCCSQLAHICPS